LYTVADAENFSIDKIFDLYTNHVNPSQVNLFKPFSFSNELVEYAHGSWIRTKSKRSILDATGGIGVLNHGHNHPRILKIREKFQHSRRMEVHKNFFSPYVAALSANISKLLPNDLSYSYFANSGAEAVEGAIKLAYKYHNGNRDVILHSNISFHGKLLGAGSVTGSPEVHFKFPQIPNTDCFVYNSIDSLASKLREYEVGSTESKVFALIVEPISASTMRSCDIEFLLKLRELCDKYDIVLIFDEVYSGWGKTGYLFNFMRCEFLVPDILVYAKSFGGGKSSISGYSYSRKIAESYNSLKDVTLHSTTYYGFGEECATAIEALNIIEEENFVKKSFDIGVKIKNFFDSHDFSHVISEVRGSGALWGLILKVPEILEIVNIFEKVLPKESIFSDKRFASKLISGAYVDYLYEQENVLTYFGSNIDNPLIISLPLVTSDEDLDFLFNAISNTFKLPRRTIISNFVKKRLS
jgi:putrescine aminotransferase